MNTESQKVLVIDDEPDILELLNLTLSRMGLDVTTVENLGDARRALQENDFSFCLTDMRLPDGNGLDLLKKFSTEYKNRIIVLTGTGSIQIAVNAMKEGAFDFMEKPLERERVLLVLRNALDKRRLAEENLNLKQEVEHKLWRQGDTLYWDFREAAAPAPVATAAAADTAMRCTVLGTNRG